MSLGMAQYARSAALLVVIVGAIGGGVWWHGYNAGVSAEEARQAQAARELNDRLRRAEEARRAATQAFLRERAEAADLERRLSDEAREDPDADRRALGIGSVRRIDSVR